MSDVPVNVESPEDRERALAIERAEVARTIQAQVTSVESDIANWIAGIEPMAQDYYKKQKQAEKALLLSIAISLNRTAGNKPVPNPTSQGTDTGDIARAVVKRVRGKMAERPDSEVSEDNPDTVRAKIRTRVGKRYGSGAEGRKQPRKHK